MGSKVMVKQGKCIISRPDKGAVGYLQPAGEIFASFTTIFLLKAVR
jgi:hypothetical protein